MSDSLQVRIPTESLGNTAASQTGKTAEPSQTTKSPSRNPDTGGSGEDRVELSSLSESIASAGRIGDAQQAGRVRQLASLYATGRYQVDSLDVSKAIVAEALGTGTAGNGR